MPRSEKPLPLIIWVHGGAWPGGSKNDSNPATAFLEQGYAVASINYRPSQHALYPAQIQDCKEAVRFLRTNTEKYNHNLNAFGVWGASAGGRWTPGRAAGHNCRCQGTGIRRQPAQGHFGSRTVCSGFLRTDLIKMAAQSGPKSAIDHDSATSPASKLVGGAIQENKEKAAKANPINYVTKESAPFLILHGNADPLVPAAQSERLQEVLKKAGVPVELVFLKRAEHGGPSFASKENLEKIARFFETNLKKK